jgi:hypothetical protein
MKPLHKSSMAIRVALSLRQRLAGQLDRATDTVMPASWYAAQEFDDRNESESLLSAAFGLSVYVGALAFAGWAMLSQMSSVFPSIHDLMLL